MDSMNMPMSPPTAPAPSSPAPASPPSSSMMMMPMQSGCDTTHPLMWIELLNAFLAAAMLCYYIYLLYSTKKLENLFKTKFNVYMIVFCCCLMIIPTLYSIQVGCTNGSGTLFEVIRTIHALFHIVFLSVYLKYIYERSKAIVSPSSAKILRYVVPFTYVVIVAAVVSDAVNAFVVSNNEVFGVFQFCMGVAMCATDGIYSYEYFKYLRSSGKILDRSPTNSRLGIVALYCIYSTILLTIGTILSAFLVNTSMKVMYVTMGLYHLILIMTVFALMMMKRKLIMLELIDLQSSMLKTKKVTTSSSQLSRVQTKDGNSIGPLISVVDSIDRKESEEKTKIATETYDLTSTASSSMEKDVKIDVDENNAAET